MDRAGLVNELASETGLKEADAKNLLNALVLLMNREIQAKGSFDMPDVGVLARGAGGTVIPTNAKKPVLKSGSRGRGQIPPIALHEGTFTPDAVAPKRRGQIPPPPR